MGEERLESIIQSAEPSRALISFFLSEGLGGMVREENGDGYPPRVSTSGVGIEASV